MDDKPRAYTKSEVQVMFIGQLREIARYWDRFEGTEPGSEQLSQIERIEGAIFSVLNILDGTSMGLPCFDLVLRPHEDDKQDAIDNGENWFESGMVINDNCYLHDLF